MAVNLVRGSEAVMGGVTDASGLGSSSLIVSFFLSLSLPAFSNTFFLLLNSDVQEHKALTALWHCYCLSNKFNYISLQVEELRDNIFYIHY